jgi:hypothetical protein
MIMKTKLMMLLVCAGLLPVFVGCETTPIDHGAYLPENVAINDLENRTALVLLDRRVQTSVTCPGIQEARMEDGRLQVAAHLRNRENRFIQVQANCEFKDAQGFVIDATPFENVSLDPNAQQDVRFVSMNDKAVRYTIRIRQAR